MSTKTTRPGSQLALVCALAFSVLWAVPGSSADKVPATVNKPASSAAKSIVRPTSPKPLADRVKAFLSVVERARNLQEVEDARKRAGFTRAEQQKAKQALSAPRYKQILKRLRAQDLARREAKSPTLQKRPGGRSQIGAVGLPRRDQGQPSHPQSVPRGGAPGIPRRPAPTLPFRAPSVAGDPIAFIDTVTPQPVAVGGVLNISGREFGSARGQVDLLFEDTRTRIALDIQQWRAHRIEVAISPLIDDLVGDRERGALLWVKPAHGGGLGPTRDVRIVPDPASLTPRIITVSAAIVHPGDRVTIAGHHFLDSAPGQVDFVFGARRYRATVASRDWQDDAVVAQWPGSVVEADAMDGAVEITNHAGRSATHPIRYEPRMATEELRYVQYGARACADPDMAIGYTANTRLNPLRNGWRVVSSSLTTLSPTHTLSRYCVERRAPPVGGDNPEHAIDVLCRNREDGQACVSTVVIQGPEGLAYE